MYRKTHTERIFMTLPAPLIGGILLISFCNVSDGIYSTFLQAVGGFFWAMGIIGYLYVEYADKKSREQEKVDDHKEPV